MLDAATIVGSIVGIVGGVSGIVSMVNQHKQTRIMEIGLERAFEVPEGETGKGFERKIREVINRRLNDTRRSLRDEYRPRLDRIEATLQERQSLDTGNQAIIRNLSESLRDGKTITDLADEAKRIRGEILAAQERVLAESGKYSDDIAVLGRDMEELQRRIEDMHNGIGFHDLVRTQIRLIAEQLLRMTSQREMAGQDAMIDQNDIATQHEMARQDTMVKPNEKLGSDGVANQGETVGQDWKMERDETAGHDNLYGYGG